MKKLSTLLIATLFLFTCASSKKVAKVDPYANLPTVKTLNQAHCIDLTPEDEERDSVKVIQNNKGIYDIVIFDGKTWDRDTLKNYVGFESLQLDHDSSRIFYWNNKNSGFKIYWDKDIGMFTRNSVSKN